MDNNLIEIDSMLIRQLRREGRWLAATELINAFHDDIKKNKEQLNKELLVQDYSKGQVIKKRRGICHIYYCDKLIIREGMKYCNKHLRKYELSFSKHLKNKCCIKLIKYCLKNGISYTQVNQKYPNIRNKTKTIRVGDKDVKDHCVHCARYNVLKKGDNK